MVAPYTVTLTSCGRFDLLERTLASLLPRLEGPVAKILIVEDSGDRAVAEVARRFDGPGCRVDTIVNDPPRGQTRSIDRLYGEVETEWIFHCEDDWEFFAGGFIARSFALLEEFAWLSMVSPRDPATFDPDYFRAEQLSAAGVRYRAVNPARAGPFSGLLFSPGLRRMRDYRIVGPYARLSVAANEPRVGQVYRDLGYRVAILAEPAVRHIGDDRHVQDFAKPTDWRSRQIRSVGKRLERLRWRLWPETDPVRQARRRQEARQAR